MKLIFIYGAPAVGKLTVARELARLTGFKVFHNHLSIDCIEPIFDFGTPSFFKLIELIRVETVAEAAIKVKPAAPYLTELSTLSQTPPAFSIPK